MAKRKNSVGIFTVLGLFCLVNSAFFSGMKKSALQQPEENEFQDTLAANFKNPPSQYSLIPFWSLNNTLDSAKMNWQIDQMLDKGVYGAFMHAREGLDQSETPYFSDGWWTAIEAAVRHAHVKGFFTYLYDEDKWPSGSAGGRTLQVNPERNSKKIMRYNDFQVMGPQTLQLNFANHPYAIFAGKISDRGIYDYASQVDLTALAGKEWKMPAGRWAIISFTMIKDPEKQINYMDSSTVADFLHITHDEYYKRLGPYFGNTIPGVFFDEIYANSRDRRNNIFWSDNFLEQFKKIKGYDLKPFLPLIILNDPQMSASKRYDFFDVVRTVYGHAWFTQYAKWAAAHKIWVTGHTTEELSQYIRQSDYFFTEGQLQVPCTDNEDFRYGFPRAIDFYNPKQISSLGHMYGKTRMAAEAMGSGGYTIPLEDYRYGFSMLGVYGVNLFIPHLFHYSTARPENQADWAPSWFYQNPYWKYFKQLANYAQRISYMVSQGKHACKVALVYPLTQLWLGGYTTPVDDELYRDVQQILLDNHIDYDIIDPYTLARSSSDRNGLRVGDEQYEALILPGLQAIQSACMQSVNEFVEKGGKLIAVKGLPSASEKGTPQDPFVIGSMTRIFGFEPREINQLQYHTLDNQQKERVLVNTIAAGGKGIFTRYTEELPAILRKQHVTDIEIAGEGNEWVKYQHRKIADRHVYYFMNSRKASGSFLVNIPVTGKPFMWNPETGERSPITNYRIQDQQIQLQLLFKPWESYFLVIEPAKTAESNHILVTQSDLDELKLEKDSHQTIASGWVTGNAVHEIQYRNGETLYSKKWQSANSLPDLPVSGNWDFQLTPSALDYQWTANIKSDTLSLPVMSFRPGNDHIWKTIKVTDPFSNQKGASRYLSPWDADWINYYDNRMHLPELGGGTVYFTKDIMIGAAWKDASLDMTADGSCELFINGKWVGKISDWKKPVHFSITDFLQPGRNHLLVKVSDCKGLLLQGFVDLQDGTHVSLLSDPSWQASKDQQNWLPALRYVSPPLGDWGNVERPGHSIRFPLAVEYKQALPPGAESILKPAISGMYAIYVNEQKLDFSKSNAVSIKQYLKSGKNELRILVNLEKPADGIQSPIQLICGKTSLPLDAWGKHDLEWYSGRAVYTHRVQIGAAYCKDGKKLVLDLGQVNHFAEIWINDRLVTYRSWAPFTADISRFVHPGENKLTIVVANLLANEATWNMLDANLQNKDARWWNYGSILREKEKLVSGLLGPVKMVSYQQEAVVITP